MSTWDARLRELLKLPENWDGYDARPVTTAAAATAHAIVTSMAMTPMSGGGVQVEAHTREWDLEIVVAPDGGIGCVAFGRAS